jgi:hypothetical protein
MIRTTWPETTSGSGLLVLKSLIDAGYRRLGDLRWVPNRELMGLHYIGFKTARHVLAGVLEASP